MRELKLEGNKILHLKRSEIEDQKWDDCVSNSSFDNPLAYCWVLDIMYPKWEAIIDSEYKWVFPITAIKFLKWKFISLPDYVQFLGFFGNSSGKEYKSILALLKKELGLTFVTFGQTPGINENLIPDSYLRTTYHLNLNQPYDEIKSNYSSSCKKNIRRGSREDIQIRISDSPDELIQLKSEMVKVKGLHRISDISNSRLKNLVDTAIKSEKGVLYKAAVGDELCASAFFLFGERGVNIFSAANSLGRSSKASFLIVDRFLQDYCKNELYLDFCGSDIKSIADFNSGFGAVPLSYTAYKISKNTMSYYIWRILVNI
nr:hypothetical protein [uncultured Carboxylicivirga sp.]